MPHFRVWCRQMVLAAGMTLLSQGLLMAQISYSTPGGTYSQNFDSLASTGTPAWVNDSTLPGWSLFRQPAPGTAITTTYATGTGSSNTGSFYSFGASATATERSLGGVGSGGTYFGSPLSGTVAGWIAVSFTNNTGKSLSSFKMNYEGEQWRDGGNPTPAAQTMVVEYGFGSTFATVSTWALAGASFNFTSPVFTTTGAAVNGNTTGLTAGLGGTINSLTWNNGDTLWLRFIENNDVGNDHGLSVDNFSFSATTSAIPEPTTYALLGITGVMGSGVWFYRRRKEQTARFARVRNIV